MSLLASCLGCLALWLYLAGLIIPTGSSCNMVRNIVSRESCMAELSPSVGPGEGRSSCLLMRISLVAVDRAVAYIAATHLQPVSQN
jgi:hypothetical protein